MLLWSIVCQRLAGFGCKGQKERTDRSRCLPSYSITCKILISIQIIKEQEQVYYTQHHSLKLMFDLTVVRFIKKYLKSFQNVPSWNVAPCKVAKHSSSSLWLSICLNLGFISLWNIIPLGILIIFNKICGNIILLWLTKLRMRNECL